MISTPKITTFMPSLEANFFSSLGIKISLFPAINDVLPFLFIEKPSKIIIKPPKIIANDIANKTITPNVYYLHLPAPISIMLLSTFNKLWMFIAGMEWWYC